MEIETIADLKLVARAVREGWPITDEIRKELVEKTLVRARCEDPKVAAKATDTFLTMDKRNQELRREEERRLAAEHARKLELIKIAVSCGLVGNGHPRLGESASVTG